MATLYEMFPSPYRDYGSKLAELALKKAGAIDTFPSPYGDSGSKPNTKFWYNLKSIGFRPLTRIQVLNYSIHRGQSAKSILFPSPYGDYGSKFILLIVLSTNSLKSFRPLSGIMVLNCARHGRLRWRVCRVSVPLRGLWF